MPFRPSLPRSSRKLPPSSQAWLSRQFRDPYVKARFSYPENYRSRSAFKLLELDSRFGFIKKDVRTVVDLGAAPGGWSQVVAAKLGWREWVTPQTQTRPGEVARAPEPSGYGLKADGKGSKGKGRCKGKDVDWSDPTPQAGKPEAKGPEDEFYDPFRDDLDPPPSVGRGTIVAVDLLRIEAIRGVKTLQMDFFHSKADRYITTLLQSEPDADGKADLILSDMAANSTGNKTADISSSLAICKVVFAFAKHHLRTASSMGRQNGGVLVMKHFAHPSLDDFAEKALKPHFNRVVFDKPPSSRSESREGYWVCMGWKGEPTTTHTPQAEHDAQ